MFRTIFAKLRRSAVLMLARFLPAERRRQIDRWLRGRDQFQRLRQADLVVVSPGKSGRTWLRVMLSGFYHDAYGLSGKTLLGFDNLHRKDARIPKVFFTHDNYLKDYTGNRDSKRDFYDRKVVLMVRQPQDVVVSEYFNWKYRMKPVKMYLNDFPAHGEDVSVFDFAMRPCGLVRILDLMNLWAREMDRVKDLLLIRYEEMRSDPEAVFRRVRARRIDSHRGRVRLPREQAPHGAGDDLLARRRPHEAGGPEQPAVLQGAPRQGRRLPGPLRRGGGRYARRDREHETRPGLRLRQGRLVQRSSRLLIRATARGRSSGSSPRGTSKPSRARVARPRWSSRS